MSYCLISFLIRIKFIPVAKDVEEVEDKEPKLKYHFRLISFDTVISFLVWSLLPSLSITLYFMPDVMETAWRSVSQGPDDLQQLPAPCQDSLSSTATNVKAFMYRFKMYSSNVSCITTLILVPQLLGRALNNRNLERRNSKSGCEIYSRKWLLVLAAILHSITFAIDVRADMAAGMEDLFSVLFALANAAIMMVGWYMILVALIASSLLFGLTQQLKEAGVDTLPIAAAGYKELAFGLSPLYLILALNSGYQMITRSYYGISNGLNMYEWIWGVLSYDLLLFVATSDADDCCRSAKARIPELRRYKRQVVRKIEKDALEEVIETLQDLEPFTACGFFNVDRGCFAGLLGSCITYLVILMQM